MKDQNDFFDDVSDWDSNLGDTEPLEGAEEDDDDETAQVRTVMLSKDGMLALLSLKVTARGAMIVRVDPRLSAPSARAYEDAETAARWFQRSLATSRKNLWQVVYDGAPLIG